MIPESHSKRRKSTNEDLHKNPKVRNRSKSGSFSIDKDSQQISSKRTRKNTESEPAHDDPTATTQSSYSTGPTTDILPQVNRLESLDEDNSLASSIFVDEQIISGCNSHKNCIDERCMLALQEKSPDEEEEDEDNTGDKPQTVSMLQNLNDDGSTEGEEDCDCGTKSEYNNDLILGDHNSLALLSREDTIIVDDVSIKKDEQDSNSLDCGLPILSSESSSLSLNQSQFESKDDPVQARRQKLCSIDKRKSESFKTRYLRSSSKVLKKRANTISKCHSSAKCDQISCVINNLNKDNSKSSSTIKSTILMPDESTETDGMGFHDSPSLSDYFSKSNSSSTVSLTTLKSVTDITQNNISQNTLDVPTLEELCVSNSCLLPTSITSSNEHKVSVHVYPLRSRLRREKLRLQLVARQSKPKTFNQLPYEILNRILHYLNIQDVFRMQRVSHRMKDIVDSYLGMIKRINFTNGLPFAFLPSGLDDKTLKKILSKTPKITHILGFYPKHISGSGHDSKTATGLTYAGIIDAFRCCSKMRSVEIMNVELMSHLVQYLPYVKFHGMFRNRPDLWDSEYAVKLPNEDENKASQLYSPLMKRRSSFTNDSKASPIVAINGASNSSLGYYVGSRAEGEKRSEAKDRSSSSLAQFAANYAHNAAIGASRLANLFEPRCELPIGEGCPSTTASGSSVNSLLVHGIPDPENFLAAVGARPGHQVDLQVNNNVLPRQQQHNANPQQNPHQENNNLQPLIVAPAIDAAEWINMNNLNELVQQNNNQQNLVNQPNDNQNDLGWAIAALNHHQRQINQNNNRPYQIQRLQQDPNPRQIQNIPQFPQRQQFPNNPNGQAAAAAAAVAAMLVMQQNPENRNPPQLQQRQEVQNNEAANSNSDSNGYHNGKTENISPLPSDQLIIPLPSVITSLTKLDLVSISINSLPRLDNIKYLHLKWVIFTSSDPFFHFSAPKLQSFIFNNCVGPSRFVRFVRIFAALSRATQLSRLELVGSRFVEGLIEHILDNYLSPSRNFRHLQRLILAGNKDVSEMDMGLLLIASQNSLVHVSLQSTQSKNSLFEALTFSETKLSKLETLILGYQDPYQSRLTLSEMNNLQLTESQDTLMPICSITDRGIRLMHSVCPKLLSLHLRNCPYLNNITSWIGDVNEEATDMEMRDQEDYEHNHDRPQQQPSPDNPNQVNSPLRCLTLENCSTLSIKSLERALYSGKPYPSLDTLVLRDMFPTPPPSMGCYNSLFNENPSWRDEWTIMRNPEASEKINDYRVLWMLLVIADSLTMANIGYPSLSPFGVGLGSSARDVTHFNSMNTIRSNDSAMSSFDIFLSLRLHTYITVLLQIIGGINQSGKEYSKRHNLVKEIFLGRRPLLEIKKSSRQIQPKTATLPRERASIGTQTCVCCLLEVDTYLRMNHPDVSKQCQTNSSQPSKLARCESPTTNADNGNVLFDDGLAFHPFIPSSQYIKLSQLYNDQKWLNHFEKNIRSIYPFHGNGKKSPCASMRKRRATDHCSSFTKFSRLEENDGICTRSKRRSIAIHQHKEDGKTAKNTVTDAANETRIPSSKLITPLSSYLNCFLCSSESSVEDPASTNTSFRQQTVEIEVEHRVKNWKARDACVDTHELRCSPHTNAPVNVFTVSQNPKTPNKSVNKTSLISTTHSASAVNPLNTQEVPNSTSSIPPIVQTSASNVLTTLHFEKIGLTHIVLGWLPKLKNLTVDCCPKLKGILLAPKKSDITIRSFTPCLRRVRIIRCPKFAIQNWLHTAAKLYPNHEENIFITYRPFGNYNKMVEQTLWQNATGAHVMVTNDYRHDQSERSMEEFHSNFDQLFREVMNFSEMLIRKNLIKIKHPQDSKYLTRTEHGIGWDLITDLPWIHEVCCSYLPCQHFCKGQPQSSTDRHPSTSHRHNCSQIFGHKLNTTSSIPPTQQTQQKPTSPTSSAARVSFGNIQSSVNLDQVDQLYEILADVKYQGSNRDMNPINQRNLGSFKIAKKGIHYHVQHRDIISPQEIDDISVDWINSPKSFLDYPYTDEYLKTTHPNDDFNVYSNPETEHFLPPRCPDEDYSFSDRNLDQMINIDSPTTSTEKVAPSASLIDSWQRLLLEQENNIKI